MWSSRAEIISSIKWLVICTMRITAADKFSNMRTCGECNIKILSKELYQPDDNASCSKSFTSQKLLHRKSFYFKWKFDIGLLQQICGLVFKKNHPDKFWENISENSGEF